MVIPRLALEAGRLLTKSSSLLKCAQVVKVNKRLISVTNKYMADRLYSDKHEWIEIEGNIGTVGISQYAQEALGDVVYAQLPEVNCNLHQHDECGALESVKAASELYSPVSGVVKEKNTAVEELPSLINTSCYKEGWLFKVELTNNVEIKNLMTEEQYQEFLKNQAH